MLLILVSAALFFYSVVFIVQALFLFGKGKPESTGSMVFTIGIFELLIGLLMILLWPGVPAAVASGFLVLIFAFTWISVGWTVLRGYDFTPLGNASIIMGLFMFVYTAIFAALEWWWLMVCVISWAFLFWTVTGVAYGRVPARGLAWMLVVMAFYTLLIPASLLLLGATVPKWAGLLDWVL